jgi:hypothetical protein
MSCVALYCGENFQVVVCTTFFFANKKSCYLPFSFVILFLFILTKPKKKKKMLRLLTRPSLIPISTRVLTATRALSTARPLLNEKKVDETVAPPGTGDEKKGFLKSVLYGKEEEQPFFGSGDASNATTHSKKLARGKYVHEMQSKYLGKGVLCVLCSCNKREKRLQ